MKQIPLTLWRWTRAEYDRLVDLGVLHGEPVELVGGQLVVAEPQGSYHASALGTAGDALRRSCRKGGRCESRCRWPSTTSPSRSQTWPW
jgi:hypothetical protein